MRQLTVAVTVALAIALPVTADFAAGAFDKAEYAARRSRLMEKIGDGAAVVLGAPTPAATTPSARGTISST